MDRGNTWQQLQEQDADAVLEGWSTGLSKNQQLRNVMNIGTESATSFLPPKAAEDITKARMSSHMVESDADSDDDDSDDAAMEMDEAAQQKVPAFHSTDDAIENPDNEMSDEDEDPAVAAAHKQRNQPMRFLRHWHASYNSICWLHLCQCNPKGIQEIDPELWPEWTPGEPCPGCIDGIGQVTLVRKYSAFALIQQHKRSTLPNHRNVTVFLGIESGATDRMRLTLAYKKKSLKALRLSTKGVPFDSLEVWAYVHHAAEVPFGNQLKGNPLTLQYYYMEDEEATIKEYAEFEVIESAKRKQMLNDVRLRDNASKKTQREYALKTNAGGGGRPYGDTSDAMADEAEFEERKKVYDKGVDQGMASLLAEKAHLTATGDTRLSSDMPSFDPVDPKLLHTSKNKNKKKNKKKKSKSKSRKPMY